MSTLIILIIIVIGVYCIAIKYYIKKLSYVLEELKKSRSNLRQQCKELKMSQKLLKDTNNRYRLVVEGTSDGIWDYDIASREFSLSDNILKQLGHKKSDINTMESWYFLVHPDDLGEVYNVISKYITLQGHFYKHEYRVKNAFGKYIWIREYGKALFNENGTPYKVVGCYTDISNIKLYEEKLKKMAYTDALTGLPNRRYLEEKGVINLNDKQDGLKAFIFLDIDNFKMINDSLGHNIGDRAMVIIAQKLSRFIDDKDKVLCRIEGDEMVIYLSDIEDEYGVVLFIEQVRASLNNPINIGDNILHITASMGIAMYPRDGITVDELLKKADIAMYKAKENGKNRYEFFTSSYLKDLEYTMNIENALRHAIKRNELILYYQPKVAIQEMKVTGFEALVRWEREKLEFVPPSDFITIAEHTGLIVPIGEWIMMQASCFIKKYNEEKNKEYSVSINVSVVQLMQENFTDIILKILDETQVNPRWLELEITETTLVKSAQLIIEKLKFIREKGIKVALDDFGKEHSSLSYLRLFPIDTLKIDKGFIDDIKDKISANILVDSVIDIGEKMGLDIVAEGIENMTQLNYLKKYKHLHIQGYIFSKPVPEEYIQNVIEEIESIGKTLIEVDTA